LIRRDIRLQFLIDILVDTLGRPLVGVFLNASTVTDQRRLQQMDFHVDLPHVAIVVVYSNRFEIRNNANEIPHLKLNQMDDYGTC
jgi:hypothetical protein